MGRGRPEHAKGPGGPKEKEKKVAGPKKPAPEPASLPEAAKLKTKEREELVNELLIRAGLAR